MNQPVFSDPYAYGYLTGALLNLGVWTFMFWLRPDLRREMLVMSTVAVLVGLPHEYWLWTRDWWHPHTITGSRIGFEDLLYAVSTGGLLSVLHAFVFRLRRVPGPPQPSWPVRLLPLAADFFVPFVLVPVFGVHSVVACGIGVFVALTWILAIRPELLRAGASSAALGVVISLPCYWLLEWLFPGFIATTWDLPNLSGVRLFEIPIEDLIWYSYTAALFGTYFKFYTGSRLEPAPVTEEPGPIE